MFTLFFYCDISLAEREKSQSFIFALPLLLSHFCSPTFYLPSSGVKWRVATKATPSKEHATVSATPIPNFTLGMSRCSNTMKAESQTAI